LRVTLLQKEKEVAHTTIGKDGHFKFEKILPGRYTVRVEQDDFCWQ